MASLLVLLQWENLKVFHHPLKSFTLYSSSHHPASSVFTARIVFPDAGRLLTCWIYFINLNIEHNGNWWTVLEISNSWANWVWNLIHYTLYSIIFYFIGNNEKKVGDILRTNKGSICRPGENASKKMRTLTLRRGQQEAGDAQKSKPERCQRNCFLKFGLSQICA